MIRKLSSGKYGFILEKWIQKRVSGATSGPSRPGRRPRTMSEPSSISNGVVNLYDLVY